MYRDPKRLSVTRGGGRLLVVGMPLLMAGAGSIVAAYSGMFANERGWGAPFVPLGVALAAVGAVMALLRWGYVVDAGARSCTRWWGFLFPLVRRRTSLESATHVAVSREFRETGGGRYTRLRVRYPVRLEGCGVAIDVDAPRDQGSARRRAKELARLLGLGIRDSSTGELVVLDAKEVDESLRGRVRRTGERPARPTGPPPAGLRVEERWGEIVFEIPAPGLRGGRLASAVVPVAIAIPGLLLAAALTPRALDAGITRMLRSPIGVGLALLVASELMLVALAVRIAAGAWRTRRLRVWPDGVRLEVEGPVSTALTELASAEIEDVEVVAGVEEVGPGRFLARAQPRIVLRSDRVDVEFGQGLSRAELEWLRDTVRFIVTS